MWNTERGAKVIQALGLIALGYVASKDVDRTMRQQPMTREQQEQVQAWAQRREPPR